MQDTVEIEALVKLFQQQKQSQSTSAEEDEEALMRYRYNSVFQFLLDFLVASWNGIPPSLKLAPFIRETLEFCRTSLAARYEK